MPVRSARPKTRAPERPAALTAIYARISEDGTGTEAGVSRQLADCHALADRHGWPVNEFVDNDISASKYSRKQRPKYRAMVEGIRDGEIDRIVCYHIDRLYRQPRELEELIDLADAGTVEIVSVYSGSIDLSNSDGLAMARVMVAFAAKSSDDSSRRILRQRAEMRSQGLPPGGARAFGWSDQMTPDPAEAAQIAAGMRAVLAGDNLSEIARSWNRAGIGPRNAKRWTGIGVRQVLTNPRHAGLLSHYGEVVGDAAWPAIVDRATYERVIAIVAARGAPFAGIPHRSHLLTGLVRCGRCGATLTRSVSRQGRPQLVCNIRHTAGSGCGLCTVAEPVEAQIVDMTFARVDSLALAEVVGEDHPDDSAVVFELAAVEARQGELGELFATGKLNPRAFQTASAQLDKTATALRSQLAAKRAGNALAIYAGRPGVLAEAWPTLPMSRRRTIIEAALGTITILPFLGGARNRFDPRRIVIPEQNKPEPSASASHRRSA